MASHTPGTPTALVVSRRGQITLPKPVRARLRLVPGSVLLLREEAGKIVLDPAAVTPVELYADEETERLVGADRVNPGERAALRRRWSFKPGARRRGGRG
jgi:AbrB family looped-hinge helix DNA binding protein